MDLERKGNVITIESWFRGDINHPMSDRIGWLYVMHASEKDNLKAGKILPVDPVYIGIGLTGQHAIAAINGRMSFCNPQSLGAYDG